MSIPLHVDSRWRNRNNDNNTNPAEFDIPVEVTEKWQTANRTVQAVRPHNKMQATNMVHTVQLLNLTIPYDIGGSVGTTAYNLIPFVYVTLRTTSSTYTDEGLVNTLEDGRTVNVTPDLLGVDSKTSLRDVTFVAYCDKLQGASPQTWIQFKCNMYQTYRINLKNSLKFRVFTPDGKTLPIVDNAATSAVLPARQVSALFEFTPYVREDRYDNHLVTLYDNNA